MKTAKFRKRPTDWAAERGKLRAWLAEWEIEKTLADAAGSAVPPEQRSLYVSRLPRRLPSVRAGGVWLAPPTAAAEEFGPLFIAVLAPARDTRTWWLAPLGRLAVPALPTEFATRLPQAPLRVLQLQFAVIVNETSLVGAWRTGRLPAAVVRAALAVWTALRAGRPLPARSAARVGPPLRHPGDPRHAYLAEEAVRTAWLTGAAVRERNDSTPDQPAETHLLAAEYGDDYAGD